jgi:hypothetical protein
MQEFLRLLAEKKLNVRALISHEYRLTKSVRSSTTCSSGLVRAWGLCSGTGVIVRPAGRIDGISGGIAMAGKVNIALIGCGGMGRGHLLRAVEIPELEFVAYVDIVEAARRALDELADATIPMRSARLCETRRLTPCSSRPITTRILISRSVLRGPASISSSRSRWR